VLLPVLMTGSIAIEALMGKQVDTRDRRVAVIDHTGSLYAALAAQAEQHNQIEIRDEHGKQVGPRFLLESVAPAADLPRQRLELSDRIRDKQLSAFVELGSGIVEGTGNTDQSRVRYYSNSPTDRVVPRWLERMLNQTIQAQRLRAANIPPAAVRKATQPVPVDDFGLLSLSASGQVVEAEQTDRAAAFLAPFGLMMLMFVGVMVGATPLLQAIIEEKMLRIAEVLLGSVPPFQLMLGKLLGVVGVSLTIISVYRAGGYAVLHHFGKTEMIHVAQIGWLLAFAVAAIVMFGSIFCAIGASCSEIKDAQSLMTPVMILVVLPMLFLQPVLESPSGTLATALSFFPPATPMIMIVRMAIPPGVPHWQPIVGMIGVLAFATLCVFAAGRIFRIGILLQGKPPRLADLLRWALRG
jgi:ABC-2 type transport system permease protein